MRLKINILIIVFTICSYGYSTEKESLTYRNLEEIVVSHTNKRQEVTPVQTLEGKELERLSAYSVADAVRNFAGVQIKDYGGIGGLKTINVRSMGSHHTAIFFDGIEVGNGQNGIIDLGRFSLENMEAISIYNGQKSSIFQSAKDYSSASALYMQSRKPKFGEGKSYNINLGLKAGSFKSINPSILWEQAISKRISASVSGEYSYSSGEYPFTYSTQNGYDTTAIRQNGDIRQFRAEAALFGKINKGEWQIKGYIYNSERGYPGAVVRGEAGKFKNEDRQWDRNYFVQGSIRKMIKSWYSVKLNGKYANDYLHYKSGENATFYANDIYKQQETYLSCVNMFSVRSWLNMAIASDIQHNRLNSDMQNFAYPRQTILLSSASADFRYKKIMAQGTILYTHSHNKSRKEAAKDVNKFTPTVVISYMPFKNQNIILRGFYKRIFRLPTLNELYYVSIGNVNLNPEFATQYNIGSTYNYSPNKGALTSLEVQADIYYNQIEDKIIATPTSNQFRWSMLNLGYVEIKGVDLSIKSVWQISNVTLQGGATYTYQKAQEFTDKSSPYYGGQIPYIPWHSATLLLGCDYNGWGLNYSLMYTGKRYISVANIAENYAQPWYTSDISISKDFTFKKQKYRIATEINNLFNQQYEVVECYPMPGINFKVKLKAQF